MNRIHHWFCRSERWRRALEQRVSWAICNVELGDNLLELGPGYGLSTTLLRVKVQRLTAIEIDPELAHSLRLRWHSSNVEIVAGDSTAMPFADGQFSSGVAFTMPHHVPSRELQDQLLRQVWRVLQPGGFFLGSDSLQSWAMRLIHVGDTLVPIDPNTFARRLESAGFDVLNIEKRANAFRFQARRR